MPQITTMLSEPARKRRMRAVGQTLAAARGEMSQSEISAKLGFPQTTISRWERGTVDLTMEQALEIELALNLKPGSLAEAGGYVVAGKEGNDAGAKAIEALLRRCPDIDADLRALVITALKTQVATTQRLTRQESITTLPLNGSRRRRRAHA